MNKKSKYSKKNNKHNYTLKNQTIEQAPNTKIDNTG